MDCERGPGSLKTEKSVRTTDASEGVVAVLWVTDSKSKTDSAQGNTVPPNAEGRGLQKAVQKILGRGNSALAKLRLVRRNPPVNPTDTIRK